MNRETISRQRTIHDNAKSDVVARFREAAAAIGSQAKAAKAACVSVGSMKAYLAGKLPPSVKALGNIAAASGFSLDWILTGEGDKMRESTAQPDSAQRPLDAALAWGIKTRELLDQLHHIREIYSSAGAPLSQEEEDEIVGDALDIIESVPIEERRPWLVGTVTAVHESASKLVASTRCGRSPLVVGQRTEPLRRSAKKPRGG